MASINTPQPATDDEQMDEFMEFSSLFVGPPEHWEWELVQIYEGADIPL